MPTSSLRRVAEVTRPALQLAGALLEAGRVPPRTPSVSWSRAANPAHKSTRSTTLQRDGIKLVIGAKGAYRSGLHRAHCLRSVGPVERAEERRQRRGDVKSVASRAVRADQASSNRPDVQAGRQQGLPLAIRQPDNRPSSMRSASRRREKQHPNLATAFVREVAVGHAGGPPPRVAARPGGAGFGLP